MLRCNTAQQKPEVVVQSQKTLLSPKKSDKCTLFVQVYMSYAGTCLNDASPHEQRSSTKTLLLIKIHGYYSTTNAMNCIVVPPPSGMLEGVF